MIIDVKLSEQIEKHRATLDRENPQDFIDVYLIAMEEDEGLNTDDLAMNLFDFLLAGTETSSTTLKWLVPGPGQVQSGDQRSHRRQQVQHRGHTEAAVHSGL